MTVRHGFAGVIAVAAVALTAFLALSRPASAPQSRTAQELPEVAAYPLPGTLTASPRSQISLRGAPPSELGRIVVTGSRSGRHGGALKPHSDGQGASFVPSRPFAAGERVSVRTGLDVVGARNGDYAFTIGRRPPPKLTRPAAPAGKGRGAVRRFVTRPDLIPPAVTVTTRKPGRADGLVFIAPKGGRGQDGPMIVDDSGHVVWFMPAGNREEATDFRVQTYRGEPVLTWWQGRLVGGEGRGEGVIYNRHYRPVRRVRAGNGYRADLHEFTLTPRGTALLVIYDAVKRGSRTVVEGVVQEIDIATGLVVFEWHSLGNVGLSESYEPAPKHGGQWDYLHMNSVALDAGGDFVISSRHTSAVIKVDRKSGRIEWRLGGKRSTLKLGPGVRFAFQHDARPQPDGTLTIYDNSRAGVRRRSRAITVRIDGDTAKLAGALVHPRGLQSATQGSMQPLPGGGTFVGFGSQRWFTEYDAKGRVVFDGHLARGNDTYRAYRLPWTGEPASRPRIAVRRGTVRVSWNGATAVARWQLLAGPEPDALAPVRTVARTGFETAVPAPPRAYVAMRALDASGAALGESPAISPARRR
jgi:hypothetical protein